MNVYNFTYNFSSIRTRLLLHSFFRFPFIHGPLPSALFRTYFAHNYRFTAVPRVVMWLMHPLYMVHFTRYIMCCCEQSNNISKLGNSINEHFHARTHSLLRISLLACSLHLWLIPWPSSSSIQILIINIQYTCFNQKKYYVLHVSGCGLYLSIVHCANGLHEFVCDFIERVKGKKLTKYKTLNAEIEMYL